MEGAETSGTTEEVAAWPRLCKYDSVSSQGWSYDQQMLNSENAAR